MVSAPSKVIETVDTLGDKSSKSSQKDQRYAETSKRSEKAGQSITRSGVSRQRSRYLKVLVGHNRLYPELWPRVVYTDISPLLHLRLPPQSLGSPTLCVMIYVHAPPPTLRLDVVLTKACKVSVITATRMVMASNQLLTQDFPDTLHHYGLIVDYRNTWHLPSGSDRMTPIF